MGAQMGGGSPSTICLGYFEVKLWASWAFSNPIEAELCHHHSRRLHRLRDGHYARAGLS